MTRLSRVILIWVLCSNPVWAAPDTTMSVTPAAVSGTTITAADENSRNSAISTAYNSHSHTDISQTANTLNVGDGTAGDKTIAANAADTTDYALRYDDTLDIWKAQQRSSTFNTLQTASGTTPIAVNAILTSADLGVLQSGTTTIYTTSPLTTLGDIRARAYNSGNFSLTSGTAAVITLDSERWDTDTIHSTSSNTSRLTATTAGHYAISGSAEFAASGAEGRRYLEILLNGATVLAVQDCLTKPNDPADTIRCSVSTTYTLSATDYVELRAFQNAASTLNVLAASNYSPEFSMVKAP